MRLHRAVRESPRTCWSVVAPGQVQAAACTVQRIHGRTHHCLHRLDESTAVFIREPIQTTVDVKEAKEASL